MMKLSSALSLIMALCLISANLHAQDEPGGRPDAAEAEVAPAAAVLEAAALASVAGWRNGRPRWCSCSHWSAANGRGSQRSRRF